MTKVIHISTASRSRTGQDPIAGNRYSWHAQLGRALAARTPYSVECWSLDVATKRTDDETINGIRYRVFPSDRFVRPYREWSTYLLDALRSELQSQETIVHLHGWHSWQSYAICRSFPTARIVVHNHSTAKPPLRLPLNAKRLLFVPLLFTEQLIENRALRSVRHCFIVNSASGQYFKQHGVPTTFCPMAPQLEELTPHGNAEAKQKPHLQQDEAMLLSVGGFMRVKGLEFLLSVFNHVRRVRPARLFIIGHTYDQKYRRLIEQQIQDFNLSQSVVIVDHVPRKDLSWYYAAADALLVTSRKDEGGPLVTLEACALGTQVVSTPVGFVPDFAPRANGLITVSDPDVRTFTSRVLRTLVAPPSRKPMVLWTWDDVVRTVLPVYESLLLKP